MAKKTGNNEYVLEAFINKLEAKTPLRNIINGYYQYKGRTLTTDGRKLVNYDTVIAEWRGYNTVAVNTKKYSMTTSHIQSKLGYMLDTHRINVIEM